MKKNILAFTIIVVVIGAAVLYLLSSKENKYSQIPTGVVDQNSWVKHTGEGFFKYSILAPENAYVCIKETAGEGSCFPSGVYLNDMQDFPYGIEFEQTTLQSIDLQSLVDTFGYQNYQESNINFDRADNQIMIKGNEERSFWTRDNSEVKAKVYFTKYLFTYGNEIYMPKIYTDEKYTNLELYQNILKTWQFTE